MLTIYMYNYIVADYSDKNLEYLTFSLLLWYNNFIYKIVNLVQLKIETARFQLNLCLGLH